MQNVESYYIIVMFLFLKRQKLILLWDLLQNEVQQNKKNRSKPNNIFVALSAFVIMHARFKRSKVNTFLHI